MFSVKSVFISKDGISSHSTECITKENDIYNCSARCITYLPYSEVKNVDVTGYILFLKVNNIITEEKAASLSFFCDMNVKMIQEELTRTNELDGGKRSFTFSITKVRDLTEEEQIEQLKNKVDQLNTSLTFYKPKK